MFCLTAYITVLAFHSATSETFYTDPKKKVDGTRVGSWSKPFETINDCVKALKNRGDQCQIRKGIYREVIPVSGLNGTAGEPFVIRGYGDERPTLDGTVQIAPKSGTWQRDGDIYFGKIDQVIWQLFFDDLLMTNARWPNANWSEKTVFDGRHHWAKTSKNSKKGKIIDRGDALKNSGKNMTDAMAVMNIGSWNTFVAPVKSHIPGQNFFTYDDTFGDGKRYFKRGRYFIEDKLDLLDAPEEWFFDKGSGTLYFIPPAGKPFESTTSLRGKVQTYALTISDSAHVILKNLDFFGTTLKGTSNHKKGTFIDQIKFDSLKFSYPCASKRMLLDRSVTECTQVSGRRSAGKPTDKWSSFTFLNNIFHGADGVPLAYEGSRCLMENNLFEYNDWTSANSLAAEGGHGTAECFSIHDTYIRNTFRYNGESHGLRPGFESNVTLNRVMGQCWGLQANDGASIQVTVNMQRKTTVERNWVHDSPKYGVRFDGQPPRSGDHGTMKRNVFYRLGAGGAQVKGDYHTAVNNLAFDEPDGQARKFPGCSLCVWKTVRANPIEINMHSTVVNNLADAANGGGKYKNGKLMKPLDVWPVQGVNVTNFVDLNIKSMLHDPDNDDFRPFSKKITIGPYPYSADSSTYWIPGRQLDKASSPVPPHDAHRVLASRRNAVMWLNARGCDTHHVYLGTTMAGVAAADAASREFVGTATEGGNVVYLKEKLGGGVKYFWRVDAECGGTIVRGDLWKFSTV